MPVIRQEIDRERHVNFIDNPYFDTDMQRQEMHALNAISVVAADIGRRADDFRIQRHKRNSGSAELKLIRATIKDLEARISQYRSDYLA